MPQLDGIALPGLQHKYPQTVLFFPAAGQSCHAYCTFCFRWPQCVGMDGMKFDASGTGQLVAYPRRHPEVMNTRSLSGYIEPLLAPELAHIQNVRIGTKSVAYWPQHFVDGRDADALLRLFGRVVAAGKSLALMAHYNHPVELRGELAQRALIRHINEDPRDWAELWQTGVRMGAVPYYMFVERDSGPSEYFRLPLARAHAILQCAYQLVSGLARTVRGPSMSALPGKVVIDGVAEIGGAKVFALQFLQARQADWVRRPFYARYDAEAHWLDDSQPAFGARRFFFEEGAPPARKVIPLHAAPAAPLRRHGQ